MKLFILSVGNLTMIKLNLTIEVHYEKRICNSYDDDYPNVNWLC